MSYSVELRTRKWQMGITFNYADLFILKTNKKTLKKQKKNVVFYFVDDWDYVKHFYMFDTIVFITAVLWKNVFTKLNRSPHHTLSSHDRVATSFPSFMHLFIIPYPSFFPTSSFCAVEAVAYWQWTPSCTSIPFSDMYWLTSSVIWWLWWQIHIWWSMVAGSWRYYIILWFLI